MSELVPVGLAGRPEQDSLFDDLLNRVVIHERMGGQVSTFLLRSALASDLALLVLVVLGSTISADGAGRVGLFVFGGGIVAGLIHLLQALTWPLVALALAGLALNVWSRGKRTPQAVHVFCAAQTVPVLAVSSGWVLVGTLFAIAVILWIAFFALCVAAMFAILYGLIASAGS